MNKKEILDKLGDGDDLWEDANTLSKDDWMEWWQKRLEQILTAQEDRNNMTLVPTDKLKEMQRKLTAQEEQE